ncbi:unnamed protein product, partial [Mesorhabditis spiculigera]
MRRRLGWVLVLLLLAALAGEADSKKKKTTNDYSAYGGYSYGGAYSGYGDYTFVDELQPVYGVVYGISAPILILFLYLTLVGIRYVFVEKSRRAAMAGGARDVLDDLGAGLCLLYIESIVTSIMWACAAKARYGIVYNAIWLFLYLPLPNAIIAFCWWAKFNADPAEYTWWYDPVEALFSITAILSWLLMTIYLVVILVLSLALPFCCRKRKDPHREMGAFPIGKMWLTLIYGLVPQVLIMPTSLVPLMTFMTTNFQDLLLSIMNWVTGSSSGGGSSWLMTYGLKFLGYQTYYVLYLPVVMCFLALVCFPCFWRAFIVLLTCGRLCASNKSKRFGSSPPPSYPGAVDVKDGPPKF